MKFHDGWWVTDKMTAAGSHVGRSKQMVPHLARIEKKRVAVQAGGHIGVYPKLLAKEFQRVYTFEPELTNFECLVRNAIAENVYAARGAIGDKRGCAGLRIHSKNSGGHSMSGPGVTPMYRIDDMELDVLDGLFLDLEGFEMHALRGAMNTIKKYKPLIVAEENKKTIGQGFKFGDIERLLAPIGYTVVERVGEDIVLSC